MRELAYVMGIDMIVVDRFQVGRSLVDLGTAHHFWFFTNPSTSSFYFSLTFPSSPRATPRTF